MNVSIVVFVILALVVIVAGTMILITVIKHRRKTIAAHLRAEEFVVRQQEAVWASATIINSRGGIITGDLSGVSTWASYEMSLEVHPSGGESYLTKVTWLVEVAQMSFLRQGQQISVKIDQQDPKIIYPNAAWARFMPK